MLLALSSGPPTRRSSAPPADGPPRTPVRRSSITVSHEARDYLRGVVVDGALVHGARNAVASCLGLIPGDTLLLVADSDDEQIPAALLQQAQVLGAEVWAYLVAPEQTTNEAFVHRITSRLQDVQASMLITGSGSLPVAFRRRFIPQPGDRRKHAHMVGVTPAMMQQSMRADYGEVHAIGERLMRRLATGSELHVTTATGTDLTIAFDRRHRWHNASGLQTGPGWTNLPGGEVFTTPARVDGRLVADGGLWLKGGTELVKTTRVAIELENGFVTKIDAPDEIASALLAEIEEDPSGRRVGQIAFGTNTSVLTSIGALLQDLKMPGFHIALGQTCPEQTGASWSGSIELPLVPRRPDVDLDGQPIMVRGRYSRGIV